ncbi:oxidoreductase [Allokutzneria oryzae]|uniref:Oxidoreductase n=1 Tax=Allokutzneria oryzae TaxID=1378989 RepID=A0ABV6AA94_9PSEU
MDLRLDGKVALVTGASRGIGLGIAKVLAAEGMRVIGAARTITPELKETTAATVSVDLAAADGGERLVAAVLADFGGIDLVVNNVGGGDAHAGGFLTVDDAAWQRTIELNLFSAVRVTRAALPSLVERRGSIVNISSIGARKAYAPIDYGAVKAALTNLSKALSEEFGPHGVRVNTVSPGPTRSAAWESETGYGAQLAEAEGVALQDFLATVPNSMDITTGRMAEPEELGALVAFLASPHAANITGVDYRVDGGTIKAV